MLSPDCEAFRTLRTPVLVLERDALMRNIAAMAATARRTGIALRPHAKTHKSPDIASLQIKAGAIGICCATIEEAEAMASAGLPGLLITSPMMGEAKFSAVAALNRAAEVTVTVDHPAQVDGLAAAIQAGDPTLSVVVDLDVGQERTGVVGPAEAVRLAHHIATEQRLRFAGVQGYAGHAQHVIEPAERKAAAGRAAAAVRNAAAALAEAGLQPTIITGSGTGTHGFDSAGPYTELQVGSYLFMDADYGRIKGEQADGLGFTPSLFVLATVVSVNRSGQVTVDAGTKALATNGPPPAVLVGVAPGATYRFTGDEHGAIVLPPGVAAPPIGARVLIGATHCDPTVNLHAAYHLLNDDVIERWPILGRYHA
jgi:D-serine deaminase-like pyridoxal phosphate-dependent protein